MFTIYKIATNGINILAIRFGAKNFLLNLQSYN
jgi:hypothetical protein